MWFKLGNFCSESPKWKWKLFQPPWLQKLILLGLLWRSWSSPCKDGWTDGRKEGRETAEFVVYCFGKYSLFLIRTALRGVNPYKLWVTLSQPLHTFCSRGRKYLNTNMIWDLWRLLVWVELFICNAICLTKLMHYALPFIFPPRIPYHPSPRWACREEYKHTAGFGFKFQLQPGCYALAFQHLG